MEATLLDETNVSVTPSYATPIRYDASHWSQPCVSSAKADTEAGGYLNKTAAINDLFDENRRLSHMLTVMKHGMGAENARFRANQIKQDELRDERLSCPDCYALQSNLRDLQSQLGKSEYNEQEAAKCIEKMMENASKAKEEFEAAEFRLQSELNEAASKNQKLEEKYKRICDENRKLQQYTASLPTKEEQAKIKTELEDALDKKEKLKNKLRSVNYTYENLKSADKANQQLLQEKSRELENVYSDLEKSQKNLQTLEAFLKNDVSYSGELPHVTIANMEIQINDLSTEVKKYKKLCKEQRNLLKTEKITHSNQIKTLNEQLESLTSQKSTLQADLKAIQLEYKLLKSSLEELSQENCYVKQERDTLSTELQDIKEMQLGERFQTNQRVGRQLKQCISELKTFLRILGKFRQDREIDFSLLLESTSPLKQKPFSSSESSLQEEVEQLQFELKNLRTEISDFAAADVTNDCNVQ